MGADFATVEHGLDRVSVLLRRYFRPFPHQPFSALVLRTSRREVDGALSVDHEL